MTFVQIWNNFGGLEFSRNGWRRFLLAATIGGWIPHGTRHWDDSGNLTASRYYNYFSDGPGGLVDPEDSAEMADGLQHFLDESLSLRCRYDCEDLDDDERSDLREKVIPFLRRGAFAATA